jgi:serine phosphatase RsbU (regulator of sigma subunit)
VRVNHELARDARRGMYVTALYVVLDPQAGTATVACAGHKMPLIRYSAAEKKIRVIQPEGIALGFDKGHVFAKTLKLERIPIEPGDRIVIANTGPVQIVNKAGEELGEKALYRQILQFASLPTDKMLERLEKAFVDYAEGVPFPNDISLVSLARRPGA